MNPLECDCPNCVWLRSLRDEDLYNNMMAYIMEKLRRIGAKEGTQVVVMITDSDSPVGGTVVDLKLSGKAN